MTDVASLRENIAGEYPQQEHDVESEAGAVFGLHGLRRFGAAELVAFALDF